ncbi:MAG: hypothetical protein K2I19_01365, partial [Muribaculaceae bacterium]|nr:hypothetical protein [Muribaculaceae bacterium]
FISRIARYAPSSSLKIHSAILSRMIKINFHDLLMIKNRNNPTVITAHCRKTAAKLLKKK